MEIPKEKICICVFIVDILLCLTIIFGNVLTILAIKFTRRLRSIISSYFVLSLAISDLMVGLTLPYRLTFIANNLFSGHKINCLMRFVLICFTCSASIYNVTAIAIDRYMAIVYPLRYDKFMTKRKAFIVIMTGWIFSFAISSALLYWNKYQVKLECQIGNVIPRLYALTIIIPTLIIMWLIIILTYWRIAQEAKISVKKLKINNMDIRISKDRKSIQLVLLILISFSACWLPFSIIAFMRIYHWDTKSTSVWYEVMFSFLLANSGVNPLIYAWKNTKFRRAFYRLLHCQLPDKFDYLNSSRNYTPRKNNVMMIDSHEDNSTLPKIVLRTVNNLS